MLGLWVLSFAAMSFFGQCIQNGGELEDMTCAAPLLALPIQNRVFYFRIINMFSSAVSLCILCEFQANMKSNLDKDIFVKGLFWFKL